VLPLQASHQENRQNKMFYLGIFLHAESSLTHLPLKESDFPFQHPDISTWRSGECAEAHLEHCLRLLAVFVFNRCLCCRGSKDCGLPITGPCSPLGRQHGHRQPAQESCRICSLDLENYLTKDHGLTAAVENKYCKDGDFEFLGRSLKSLLSLGDSLLYVNPLSRQSSSLCLFTLEKCKHHYRSAPEMSLKISLLLSKLPWKDISIFFHIPPCLK